MTRISLVMGLLLSSAGCSSYDRAVGTRFEPGGDGTFEYEAYGVDSPSAEATRMEWLRQYLGDNGLCPDGYEIIDRRPVVTRTGLLENGYTVYYKGRCT